MNTQLFYSVSSRVAILTSNNSLKGVIVRCKAWLFAHSGFITFKPFVVNCLIVLVLFEPSLVYSDQSENSLAYHQLITRIFPELDAAIFEVLEPTGITGSKAGLKNATIWAYRTWHKKVQAITNSSVPANAKLLTEKLKPDGFDRIMKNHQYESPQLEGYSEVEIVTHYFLQIVGTVIKKNKSLEPLQEELVELFQCNNRDCEQLAGITVMNDNPISPSDEIKLQLFVECTQRTRTFSENKKNDFCDAFLLHTSF